MPGADAIEVEGLVVEVLPNKTYRVELPNGHRVLGFLSGKARLAFIGFNLGQKVRLAMSPYDLSEGRILAAS
ncbi:MAG TPA: translation initiation factor IF-1 [Verrucomicrobiae bacterium]|nr:translation initiation factor IF-1 [Verrucomicrobiae bacterium]